MRFNATIKQNGKLHIHNRVEFDRHVDSLRRDDKEVKVTIEVNGNLVIPNRGLT